MTTTDVGHRPCVGCLDRRTCWVCSGTGTVFTVDADAVCRTCTGRGLCSVCRPVPEQREHRRAG